MKYTFNRLSVDIVGQGLQINLVGQMCLSGVEGNILYHHIYSDAYILDSHGYKINLVIRYHLIRYHLIRYHLIRYHLVR
jgi:hypothetical protein